MNSPKSRLIGVIVNTAAVLCAAALIWVPEISAYWVWPPTVTETVVSRSRTEPTDEVLTELARQRLGMGIVPKSNPVQERDDALKAAEQLLAGQAQFKWQPLLPLRVPFEKSNLDAGPPTYTLFVAGMGTVDLLLQAYRISRDEKYVRAARAEVANFAEVDRRSIVPRGLLWNDHALAYRMSTLIEFWQLVRGRPDFDAESSQQVLELAARTASRLAKPELFTYRSNHGVMQNVALLQYVTAFPLVHADAARLRELACARLRDQMGFYMAAEGPVLEHSASYHELGDYLLETSIRLFDVNQCEIPTDWLTKLNLAKGFSAMLNRPDGSMPSLGNTDYAEAAGTYVEWDREPPRQAFGLYSVSGFAVWWSGLSAWPQVDALAQTVVTWSKFPSMAHKRADDMSVILWARGRSLTGSAGYWPYGVRGFDEAQGWRGSNAPHFVGEAGPVQDPVTPHGVVDAGRVRAIELERAVPSRASTVRRQIIEIDGSTWLIADSFKSPRPQQVERIWTFLPDTGVEAIGEDSHMLRSPDANQAARVSILGGLAKKPTVLRGQYEPFGGWIVHSGVPIAAPALLVEQSTVDAPVVSVFELAQPSALGMATLPGLAAGASADRWQVTLKSAIGPTEVTWNKGLVTVRFLDGSQTTAQLAAAPDPTPARAEIVAAYNAVAAKYAVHRPITYYRYKVTYLALGLLALQEVIMFGARRRFARAVPALRWIAAGFWLAFGLYAAYWYLV